jgi:hypothetical protein
MSNDAESGRPRIEAYGLCIQELSHEYPDYQAAQVYATLSVEEALRDLARAILGAAHTIATAYRM